MELNNNDGKAKIIAYYLPQFCPNDFNNKWYGNGFTEWTNVGRAKPLFRGHNQPRVPADLGYYDLRVPEVVEMQAELARKAGVFGFAYWHYWWNGDMLLHEQLERQLASGKPDYPYCLAWANENWYKKMWDKDTQKDILLKHQTYPGEEDNRKHFEYCLPFFKDNRYITYDGRPVFYIYNPPLFKDIDKFIEQWNTLIKESGVADSFYFIGLLRRNIDKDKYLSWGFDCLTPQHSLRFGDDISSLRNRIRVGLSSRFKNYFNILNKQDYRRFLKYGFDPKMDYCENIAPQLLPRWDNTPRAKRRGTVYTHCTPDVWGKVAANVLREVQKKKNKLVFLKSWNEWAEGNYMEPDLEYGNAFIDELKTVVDIYKE